MVIRHPVNIIFIVIKFNAKGYLEKYYSRIYFAYVKLNDELNPIDNRH